MATRQEVDLLGLNLDANSQPPSPPPGAAQQTFLTATVDLRVRRLNDNEANYPYFDFYHTPIQCRYNKDTSTLYLAQLFDDKDEGFFLRYIIPRHDVNVSNNQERAINVGAIELQLEALATIFHETSYGIIAGSQAANNWWIDILCTLPVAHLPRQTRFSIKPKAGDLENRERLITIMKELGIENILTHDSGTEGYNDMLGAAGTSTMVNNDIEEDTTIWGNLDLLTFSATPDRLASLDINDESFVRCVDNESIESFPESITAYSSGHETGSHAISGPSWITSADVSSMPELPERIINGNLMPAHPWKPRGSVYKVEEWKKPMSLFMNSEEEKLKRLEQAADEFWNQQQTSSKQEYCTNVDTKYSSVPRAKETHRTIEDDNDFARAWKKIRVPQAGSVSEGSSNIRGVIRPDRGQRARGYGGRGGRHAAGPGARGRGAYSGTNTFNLYGVRGAQSFRGRGRGRGQDRGRVRTSSTKRYSTFGGDGYYNRGYNDMGKDDSVEMNRLMRSGVATYHHIDC